MSIEMKIMVGTTAYLAIVGMGILEWARTLGL